MVAYLAVDPAVGGPVGVIPVVAYLAAGPVVGHPAVMVQAADRDAGNHWAGHMGSALVVDSAVCSCWF